MVMSDYRYLWLVTALLGPFSTDFCPFQFDGLPCSFQHFPSMLCLVAKITPYPFVIYLWSLADSCYSSINRPAFCSWNIKGELSGSTVGLVDLLTSLSSYSLLYELLKNFANRGKGFFAKNTSTHLIQLLIQICRKLKYSFFLEHLLKLSTITTPF